MNALMNYGAALPEIVLSGCGLAILIFGVVQKKDSSTLCTMLVLASFAVAAMLVLQTAPVSAYSGLFVTDAFATYAKLLILAGGALSAVLALDFNEKTGIGRFEFPILMLFSTVGMMVMASAASLMTLYMGLELQSLAIYVLCAFARDDVRSSEAGLKYFVLSALASGLLLYGISLTYGFSGTMDFGRLAQAITDPAGVSTGLVVGIAFVVAGLAFKLSAVPFHMWTPDVYEGAPTPVTAFMSTAPKVAPFVVLLRVMIGPFGHVAVQWQPIIYVVSIGSMLLGSFAAIGQSNIKRLMAYSSIGHMGYALIGLAAGTETGIRGVLIYLLTYVAMSAGAFACIIAMRRGGKQVERIADLGGLARTDLGLATLLAIFMFSMAGIPPFAGFFGKLYVFLAAVQSGMWFLAILGVLTSVVGCFYYLRIIKVMFFDTAEPAFDKRSASVSFVAIATGAFTVLFLFALAPFTSAAAAAAKVLFG
jgi:NADH-quinone oxidoreductase subunit N